VGVEFSWDESKREWVLAERGMDFLRVGFALFDGRPLLTLPTPRDDEDRFLSVDRWMWRDGYCEYAEEKRFPALWG
jgi:uncharacterized DUF497 family protein